MPSDHSKNARRRPKQARARATWEAIVEAASQILERGGPEALNTNDVAERAGVSIGTLYQYFPHKQAILLAAAKRDLAGETPPPASRQKALIQALITMLEALASLGGNGRSAPASKMSRTGVRSTRRESSLETRSMQFAQRLLGGVAPSLQPVLAPIRIKGRRR